MGAPIITSIRVPEELYGKIGKLANEIGTSQNGMMLNLMYLGLKVYQAKITIPAQEQGSEIQG